MNQKQSPGERLRLELRANLIHSYKARSVVGVSCGLCRADDRPLAFNICDFYQGAPEPRLPCVPLGENSIGRRWSLPVCTVCAPPCPKCELPIVSGWIRRAVSEIQSVQWAAKAKIGLGVCRHPHPWKAILSINRRPYWTAAELSRADEARMDRRGKASPLPGARSVAPTGDSGSAEDQQIRARLALQRQLNGWDVAEHGGLTTFTRYAEQPSGFRLRLSFIPVSSSRTNVFAAIIPPPDALKCDRSVAIRNIDGILFGLGPNELEIQDADVSLLGAHGIQITGWLDFLRLIQCLNDVKGTESVFLIGLLARQPFARQLGDSPMVISSLGLLAAISAVADQRRLNASE